MNGPDFQVPAFIDYVAVVTWAMSGAIVALRKRFDIVGLFIIALLSSTGGGLMRDMFLTHRTPVVLTEPMYLPLITATTIITSVAARRGATILTGQGVNKFVDLIDAVGMSAFAQSVLEEDPAGPET